MTPAFTDMTPMLALSDLTFEVEGKRILNGLSCHSHHRRIGIVGRNGSGKSTLARLIAGLIDPTSGHAEICGVNAAKDRKAALQTIGILFQNPDHQIIFPTVEEELAFGLTQLGQSGSEAERNAIAILQKFDRAHWRKAATQTLSQGQRHLLCLMAVLAMEPKAVVLDEPFAGLDIPTKMQLTRFLDQAAPALIHITHEPEALASYDQVLWLDRGEIVQDGPANAVLPAYRAEMEKRGGTDDFADLAG